jgi:hypothetical protein
MSTVRTNLGEADGATLARTDQVKVRTASGWRYVTVDEAAGTADALTITGTRAFSAAVTMASTLGVTGAATLTGGVVSATPGFGNWQPIAATSGTDTTPANGTQWVTSLWLPANKTITNINFLIGSVGGTDKVYGVLYNSAGTNVAATDVTAGGATVGTAANIQVLALTSTYAAVGPGLYYVGISINGTTSRIRTVPAFTQSGIFGNSVAQTHGTVAAITPPTTFTADKAPIVFVN